MSSSFRSWVDRQRLRRQISLALTRPKLGTRGLMMAEIFLNALVIAYAIYHTSVFFGWTLLLFDINHQSEEQNGCPACPALPYFVHGISATCALGLVLWILGYMIDFNSGDNAPEVKKTNEDKAEDNAKTVTTPVIVVTAASPTDASDGATQAAVVARATSSAAAGGSTDVEEHREDDSAPLVVRGHGRKFKFAFNHLTCLGIGCLHIVWMGFGTALTVPMLFRLKLYSEGLDINTCNASIYWFALLTVMLQYLLLLTLFVWFSIDVVICWKRNILVSQDTVPATVESTPGPSSTSD